MDIGRISSKMDVNKEKNEQSVKRESCWLQGLNEKRKAKAEKIKKVGATDFSRNPGLVKGSTEPTG